MIFNRDCPVSTHVTELGADVNTAVIEVSEVDNSDRRGGQLTRTWVQVRPASRVIQSGPSQPIT
jgi:hypothetical protein